MAKNFYENYRPRLFKIIGKDAGDKKNIVESGGGDCMICNYVLRGLKNPVRVLKEIIRILKKSGRIIFIDFPEGLLARGQLVYLSAER